MWAKHKQQSGFTIVELLIVVVVIAILAAITVVAYNGIQQRAQNTQRVSAAKEWQKLITAYVSTNGSYANTLTPYQDCLGAGYETNWDANPNEDCGWSNNIKHPNFSYNAAYATLANLPSYPKLRQTLGGGIFVAGISIRASDTVNIGGSDKPNYPTLLYWLDGNNQDCVLRPIVLYVGSGYTTSPTAINSGNDGNLTQCRVALPDPAGL